jgi:hypothetical protein
MAVIGGHNGAFYSQKRSCHDQSNNGADCVISDPSGGELDFSDTDDFSIEIWFNAAGAKELIRKRTGTAAGYLLEVDGSGNLKFTIEDTSANEVSITGGSTVNDSKWYHVIAVRDHSSNDKLYLYLDGSSDATAVTDTTTATLATASNLTIGEQSATDAYIGAVRIYAVAISASQASSLAGGSIIRELRAALRGSWPFIEGTGSTVHDDTSYGNNGAALDSWSTLTYDSIASETPSGTIDGSNTVFTLANANVLQSGMTVTVDGSPLTDKDYQLSPKGVITCATAPSASISVDYRHCKMTLEVGGFHNWTVAIEADEQDITDFASAEWGEYQTGLARWTASCENYWYNAGYAYDLGSKLIFIFYHDETNSKSLQGWGYITGVAPNIAPAEVISDTLTVRGDDLIGVETS